MIEKFLHLVKTKLDATTQREIQEVSKLFEDRIREQGQICQIDMKTQETLYSQLIDHLTKTALTHKEEGGSKTYPFTLYAIGSEFIRTYPTEHIQEFTEAKKRSPNADFDAFIIALAPEHKPSFK